MPQHRTVWTALAAALLAVLALAVLAAWLWLPSDEDLARRAEAEASDALGVPVTVQRLHWSLWPQPGVVLEGVATEQPEPLTADRITAELAWSDLLRRRLSVTRLSLEGATVPQRSLSEFRIEPPEGGADGSALGPLRLAATPLQFAEWRGVRWVSRTGRALAYAGQVRFDPGWRPRSGLLEREGAAEPARLQIDREGEGDGEDRWRAEVTAGGRTERGELRLQVLGERWRVTGALDFHGVDVVGLMAAFDRRSIVSGRADGHTDLIAEGADPAEALRSLHTRTRFDMRGARLLTFDLERAVKSAGRQHRGSTPLDAFSGVVSTEADRSGTIVRYTDLRASSSVLTATGSAVVQGGRVQGRIAVDLVEGVVGVPLEFEGTVANPSISLPPAALAGAAVGTAVAPGVGTALGARLGETLRRLFGGEGDGGSGSGKDRGGRATPAPVYRDPD